jgi:hypothetical protein
VPVHGLAKGRGLRQAEAPTPEFESDPKGFGPPFVVHQADDRPSSPHPANPYRAAPFAAGNEERLLPRCDQVGHMRVPQMRESECEARDVMVGTTPE